MYLFVGVKSCSAVAVTISNVPSQVTADPFEITVTVTGATAGINYLRVDLYKDGTTNYFGETFNSSDWYGGSDGKSYLPITIETSKAWTGTVKARAGVPSVTEYDNQGTYKIRVRRYTGSGAGGGEDPNLSAQTVSISIPTPTPTPSPTNTPTPSPTPTKTPTPTPSPTNTPTPTPIPSLTPKPTTKVAKPTISIDPNREGGTESAVIETVTPSSQSVLAANNSSSNPQNQQPDSQVPNWGKLFIIMGVVMVTSACGILVYNKYRMDKEEDIGAGV